MMNKGETMGNYKDAILRYMENNYDKLMTIYCENNNLDLMTFELNHAESDDFWEFCQSYYNDNECDRADLMYENAQIED